MKGEQKKPSGPEPITAGQARDAVNFLTQAAAMAPLPENAHVQKNVAAQILRTFIDQNAGLKIAEPAPAAD